MSFQPEDERRRSHRVLSWSLAALAGVVVVGWIALGVLARRAGPYLQQQIVHDLSARFHGKAELGSLNVTVFPQLRAAGENLVIRRDDDGAAPFLSVRRFSVEGSLWSVLARPIRLGAAQVTGLSIVLPPKGERPALSGAGPKEGGQSFSIGLIAVDEARLEIPSSKPSKPPLIFDIQSLTMRDAGSGRGMSFSAKLTNPKPIGLIDTTGNFGPWNGETPRDTPVSGTYSFRDADLSTIKGIGGILSSKGQFAGALGQIEVQGETDTPDFTVSTGDHPMPLHTEFSATVDGSSGDTYLHPVNAILGGSKLTASGLVVHEAGGHRIVVDVTSTEARVEDLLKIAVKTSPPLLSGPINLRTNLVLPPSDLPVPERLELSGSFQLTQARFLHGDLQDKIDRLSARAEGHPKEAAKDADPPEILSSLKSDFKLGQGVIRIGHLTFEIPGAAIALTGDYRLPDAGFSFTGQARLHATISHMTTGVKSFFLRALDPFFSKQGAGTVLPIKISGAGTHPKIALDLRRLRSGK